MNIDVQSILDRESLIMAFDRLTLAPAIIMAQRALPAPEPFTPSSIGHWRKGEVGGTVVADLAADAGIDIWRASISNSWLAEHVNSYGGWLVAESIGSRDIQTAIAGFPMLARCVMRLMDVPAYRMHRDDALFKGRLAGVICALQECFPDLKPQLEQAKS